ncbi:MAG TPA: ATP-binding protein [Gemmatimonadales bacterium]|nr:ATP-binding protein [Gemmatimonadales bacterium]
MSTALPHQLLSTVEIRLEQDIVLARRRARQVAEALGLEGQDQSRLATAVSEIARNAFEYAGGGTVEFLLAMNDSPPLALVRVSDHGPGIEDLPAVLGGQYQSRTGMGLGIVGARRLTDHFEVMSKVGEGTRVLLGKRLPHRAWKLTPASVSQISAQLDSVRTLDLVSEVQEQNQELLRSLEEAHRRQAEIERLNQELEETNRGVVALYMEVDEHAKDLGRAADLKSRVLSDISHEVRTPLNAILNISRLLLDRLDGELTSEQERQVRMIRDSAVTVTDLVDDLLELARMEAGKTVARVVGFSAADLFAALRGMFRPLVTSETVSLLFDDVTAVPALETDEGKVGQILRNLISNALKFTEKGEVRVSAECRGTDTIAFSVADTGVGIADEDRDRIFQEFHQIEHPLQRRVRGTGLGLPLSRRLAQFLGGELSVQSQIGQGSTFTAVIPRRYIERRTSERRDAQDRVISAALSGAGSTR